MAVLPLWVQPAAYLSAFFVLLEENKTMKRALLPTLACVACLAFPSVAATAQDVEFLRGDANSDQEVDIADPIFVLSYIFNGGKAPRCTGPANANGDAYLDISDAIFVLSYLFSTSAPLPPLTAEEITECEAAQPPDPVVIAHGTFQDVLEPPHNIVGTRAELLSDGTVRLSRFNYDGTGVPRVVVIVSRQIFFDHPKPGDGTEISDDLIQDHPYLNETLTFSLPEGAVLSDVKYVSIWCDYFPLTYGIAPLYDGPFP
jgi:hypothetical protein